MLFFYKISIVEASIDSGLCEVLKQEIKSNYGYFDDNIKERKELMEFKYIYEYKFKSISYLNLYLIYSIYAKRKG